MKQDKQIETKTISEKNRKHNNHIVAICSLLIFVITVGLFTLAAFVYGKNKGEIIQILVFSAMSVSGLVYSFIYGNISKRFDYDNNEHPLRFFILYLIALLLAVIFPLMEEKAWAFVCLGVMLSFFSEPFTGLAAVSTLLLNTCILAGNTGSVTFIVYFAATLIAVMMFRFLDENFSFSSAILSSMFSLFIFEICGFVLLKNEEISFEQFIMPIVNMVVNGIVIFGFLKLFNETVINKYRNKYAEINDQEYKVLVDLKENHKKDYLRSIHTAHLVEIMAKSIDNCNENVAKNVAYYHRIKQAFGFSNEECSNFINEQGFPPEAREKLMEYFEHNDKLVSKECSIVYISDHFISTLMKLFEQNSKIDVDYDKVIDSMFEKEYFISTLDDSELIRKDYRNIVEIMKKERLYYDFLR